MSSNGAGVSWKWLIQFGLTESPTESEVLLLLLGDMICEYICTHSMSMYRLWLKIYVSVKALIENFWHNFLKKLHHRVAKIEGPAVPPEFLFQMSWTLTARGSLKKSESVVILFNFDPPMFPFWAWKWYLTEYKEVLPRCYPSKLHQDELEPNWKCGVWPRKLKYNCSCQLKLYFTSSNVIILTLTLILTFKEQVHRIFGHYGPLILLFYAALVF